MLQNGSIKVSEESIVTKTLLYVSSLKSVIQNEFKAKYCYSLL